MGNKFGLLGERLSHSFSPQIHKQLGNYEYSLFEVPPDGLDEFMARREFDGLNVTIPYKQDVMAYCETLSDEARAIGCVNTIVKDGDGFLHGHNTDYHGFGELLASTGVDPAGEKVLVLGDGGAAKTVRAVLSAKGACSIVTISRRGDDNYGNIGRHFDASLIVNTTPVGMYPNNGESPLSLEGFEQLRGVVDLIYNPLRTSLMIEAESRCKMSVGGLIMLTAQAEMASRLFTGAPPRPELAEKITHILFQNMQNIALVGMPGCGKSTVGRELARLTGRELVDIDEQIEAAEGRSIPSIFADGGETVFRKIESRELGDVAKKSGIIIATGGGIVTQLQNYSLLRQNSAIVYLMRDITELPTSGRPLSQREGVDKLAEARLPLYEQWSDQTVRVDPDPNVTAQRVLAKLRVRANRVRS